MSIRRIAITTGGGDCPGLNAVIRAVVKGGISHHKWEVYGLEDGFDGLIFPEKCHPISLHKVSGILPRGGTILGTTNRGNPFCYKVKSHGKEKIVDYSDRVVRNFRDLELDALVVVGGDGTQKIGLDLYKKGIPVVGIPKTIDNDLAATEVTFGFDSAVTVAMEALDRLHTTAESHHRVMVLEVMGRDAGWIALEAGLAGGADVILIPEIPYNMDRVCQAIRHRDRAGKKFSLVVVAEGAFPKGGAISTVASGDQTRLCRLGGIGQKVGDDIQQLTGHETRVTVLGHLQRGGSPTADDRILGTRFGIAALHLIAQKRFGRMVCISGSEISSVPLEQAVGTYKRVSTKDDRIGAARALGICMG